MLILTIAANNYDSMRDKLQQAVSLAIDGVEIRLDYLTKPNPAKVKAICGLFSMPKIFTLRKKSQGGLFVGSEEERLQLIEQLFTLNPDYFDLEYDIPVNFVEKMHKSYPKVQLISSYHDFKRTPPDLNKILDKMRRKEISIYKIAAQANSTVDMLRMLDFVKTNKDINLTGIAMGELGEPSRILVPIINSFFNYTHINDSQTAPGQLDFTTLTNTYNYQKLNSDTKIYALLGDPVKFSLGHIFHNQIFKQENKNAVYIKLKLQPTKLKDFFQLIKKLPFSGFSVTMPLKEQVLPYLDELSSDAKEIQAVNTIKIKQGKLIGFNTDGIGALNAIKSKTKIKGKKIIILGAGGTAKAIAYEAIKRGSQVLILNRTVNKAKKLAAKLGCQGDGFEYLTKLQQDGYDILINATSIGMSEKDKSLVPKQKLFVNKVVLDMISPMETQLIIDTKENNCIAITGKKAYTEQALEQQKIWF